MGMLVGVRRDAQGFYVWHSIGPLENVPARDNIFGSRIRRGGFVFVTFVGDHAPRDVHVYRDGRLIVKWDLDSRQAMEGSPTRRILTRVDELVKEGKL
jgi:hypothetical protein